MIFCPEAEYRAGLTDAEFWDHVYNRAESGEYVYDPDQEAIDPVTLDDPCPECGVRGACAFDIEGRPLIHATSKEN